MQSAVQKVARVHFRTALEALTVRYSLMGCLSKQNTPGCGLVHLTVLSLDYEIHSTTAKQ